MQIERDFESPGRLLVNFTNDEFVVFFRAAVERKRRRESTSLESLNSDEQIIEAAKTDKYNKRRWTVHENIAEKWLIDRLNDLIENTPYEIGAFFNVPMHEKLMKRRREMGNLAVTMIADIQKEMQIVSLTQDLETIDSPADIPTYGS